MNKKPRLRAAFALLIAACGTKVCCCECMSKQIDDEFAQMKKHPHKAQKKIKKMFSSNPTVFQKKQKFSLSQGKKNVTIKISLGDGIKSFNGNIEPNQLTIEIPEIKQTIVVRYNEKTRFLSIARKQIQETRPSSLRATTADTAEKKDAEFYSHKVRYGNIKHGQTIHDPIDLEKATFRYKNGKLTISIPKQMPKKKTPKKITVEMK